MSHLNFHPAPGLGDMAPGWFALPQNPLTAAESTVLVPTMAATVPGRWVRTPRLADLVEGSFVVPQNPVEEAINPMARLSGLGCGCAGGCDRGNDWWRTYYSLNGLGDPGSDAVSQFLVAHTGSIGTTLADQKTVAGMSLPLWGWLALAGGALYIGTDLFGKGKAASKRYAGSASRRLSAYAQNPRRARNESISQGFWRGGVFHPIRSADDYDPEAVGEKRAYAKRRTKRRKR